MKKIKSFCIAPLDVVKIRFQLQVHSLSDAIPPAKEGIIGSPGPTYKGTLATIRAIVRQEGLRGLWKGNVSAELLYVAYGAVQFSSYRSTSLALATLSQSQQGWWRKTRAKEGSAGGDGVIPFSVQSFIAGAVAGGFSTATTYPLDLLRTRFAAQGVNKVYDSLWSGVLDILRHEGPLGFFRGGSAAVIQIVPYMGLFFSSYESLRLLFRRRWWLIGVDHNNKNNDDTFHLPLGSGDAIAGIVASIIAKTGVFPLDLVRKRLQVQGPTRTRYVYSNIPEYRGVLNAFSLIVKQQGIRGLYRGLTVGLLKAAPAGAITMWTYERSLGLLDRMGTAFE